MTADPREPRPALRVGVVPGVTATKWQRRWDERLPRVGLEVVGVRESEQRDRLLDGSLDLCFVRAPVAREGLHLIPLYEEEAGVVVPADHPATVLAEVQAADLDGEERLLLGDSAAEHDLAFDLVAGGAGVIFVPQSIARSRSRRDLAFVPLLDAPPTSVGLAWRIDDANPWIEEFIGIVRGRTANSSRTQQSRTQQNRTQQNRTQQNRTQRSRRR